MGYILLGEWLNRGKLKWIDPEGQDIQKVRNNVSALMEVIKYGSKIFTEPDVNKKTKSKGQGKIYASALDNIFLAMKDLRIFERFGFNLPGEPQQGNSKSAIVKEYEAWVYDLRCFDWLNIESGHCLTNYLPVGDLLSILEKDIDSELH